MVTSIVLGYVKFGVCIQLCTNIAYTMRRANNIIFLNTIL